MLNAFRTFLRRRPLAFRCWRFTLAIFGRIVFPWRRPRLTDADIDRCYGVLERYPCAVIGLGSRRFATGAVLPRGNHDAEHTAVSIGCGVAVEAVMPRVRAISLRRLLKQYDSVTIVAFNVHLLRYKISTPYERSNSRQWALRCTDRPYNTLFDDGLRTLYCHRFGAEYAKRAGTKVEKAGDFYTFDDLAAAGVIVLEIHR